MAPIGALLLLATIGCTTGASPTATPAATPTPPVPVYGVGACVFFDENGSNALEPSETIRFGGVEVEIAGRVGVSEGSAGRVEVQNVPAGTHIVSVRRPSLPPFFTAAASISASVPATSEIAIPLSLPIGGNRPFVYLVHGDSISKGEGSDDGKGYRRLLRDRLSAHYQRSVTSVYRGLDGGTTRNGAGLIGDDLAQVRPAYTIIAWGTNDWNLCGDPAACTTVPDLRAMVRAVKAAGSLPCVASILPPNPADNFTPPGRSAWVTKANGLIRTMAGEEGALFVDTHGAFMKAPSLPDLFDDHIHPNQEGHELMAGTFFDALTRPRQSTGTP